VLRLYVGIFHIQKIFIFQKFSYLPKFSHPLRRWGFRNTSGFSKLLAERRSGATSLRRDFSYPPKFSMSPKIFASPTALDFRNTSGFSKLLAERRSGATSLRQGFFISKKISYSQKFSYLPKFSHPLRRWGFRNTSGFSKLLAERRSGATSLRRDFSYPQIFHISLNFRIPYGVGDFATPRDFPNYWQRDVAVLRLYVGIFHIPKFSMSP
jgi:hypothetical protein